MIEHCEIAPEFAEPIINRFAAVLLMPREEFKAAVRLQLGEYITSEKKIYHLYKSDKNYCPFDESILCASQGCFTFVWLKQDS